MSNLVVEAGGFDNADQEEGRTLKDRRKMMESLLVGEGEETGAGEEEDEGDTEINELMATSPGEFDLYTQMDTTRKCVQLYTNDADVPDFFKFVELEDKIEVLGERGERAKRKAIQYDDGLSEEEFVNKIEKEFDDEEERDAKKRRKG